MDTLKVPARLESLARIRQHVLEAAMLAGLDKKTTYQLELAVDEIASNTILHGYKTAPQEYISVRSFIDDTALTVIMDDDAPPYDPRQQHPPDNLDQPLPKRKIGGLGIYLALRNVDEFDYLALDHGNRHIFKMNRPKTALDRAPGQSRLLLVDDNTANRDALCKELENLGYLMVEAGDGNTALKILREQEIHLVLLGLKIPGLNGFQVLEEIKKDPGLRDIPVIVVSSVAEIDSIIQCIKLGAEDYLQEPYNPVLLETRINVLLDKRILRRRERIHIERVEKLAYDLRHSILPLGIALTTEKNYERLLERIVNAAKTICNAERGLLYLRTNTDQLKAEIVIRQTQEVHIEQPYPLQLIPLHDPVTKEPNTRYVIQRVANEGRSINIHDLREIPELEVADIRSLDEKTHQDTISVLTVPLKDHDENVIGILQLCNARDEDGEVTRFNAYQQLVVESLTSQAAVILSNQRLLENQDRLIRFEQDLQTSRNIQANFLPETLPDTPRWDKGAFFQPAREVGGDFYDLFILSHNKVGIVIADICDKGVSAALFMALVRSLVRAFAQQYYWMRNPDDHQSVYHIMMQTNEYVAYNHRKLAMFATVFFGVLNTDTGWMAYINAGHTNPLIIGDQGVISQLKPSGPSIGIKSQAPFNVQHVEIKPGQTLFTYTDGVIDARDKAGKFFTLDRLLKLVSAPAENVNALITRVSEDIILHRGTARQFDDITMLGIKRM